MPASHLHFVQSLEPLQGGGLGSAALALHTEFLTLQHPSTLLATAGQESLDPRQGVFQFQRSGPEKAYYSSGLRKKAGELMLPGTVVHGHGFYVYPNLAIGRLARQKGNPLLYHVHGIFEPWILQRSQLKKRIAHILFEDANFRRATLWRALHMKEADQIRSRGITAPIVVAPNGIHLTDFDKVPDPKAVTRSRQRIVFLSRIHPKKGLDLLIGAWASVSALFKDWEILIVGPDEGGYKAEVENMIRQSNLTETIKMHDAVSGIQKINLIKSADVFILPSYSEGFSVVILEALACGIPVIATDACNFPELYAAGAGWKCQATVESVTAALRLALSESDEERQQRGAVGRQLVERQYTWPVIAKTILDASNQHCK